MKVTDMDSTEKVLRPRHYFTIALGASIGVGWIPLYGTWLTTAGSLGVVIAFLIGVAAMIFIATAYMRLASLFPVSGGETAYAYAVLGKRPGFVTGWALIFTYLGICIFEAIAVAKFSQQLIPGLVGMQLYTFLDNDVYLGSILIGISCSIMLGTMHILGTKWVARFQDSMTFLLLLISLVFIVMGLFKGSVENLQPFFVADHRGSQISGVITVLAIVPLMIGGFNFAVQAIGERAPDVPVKAVNRSLLASLLAVGCFYAGLFFAGTMSMPREQLLAAELPVQAAFSVLFGSETFGKTLILLALLGLLTSWNSVLLGGAQILKTLSDSGGISPWFGAIHPRYSTPGNAIVFLTVLTILGTFGGNGFIGPILGSSSLTIISAYLIVCICAFCMLKHPPSADVHIAPIFLYVSIVIVLILLGIALSEPFFARPEVHLPVSWIVLFFWIGLGLLVRKVNKQTSQP